MVFMVQEPDLGSERGGLILAMVSCLFHSRNRTIPQAIPGLEQLLRPGTGMATTALSFDRS